MASSPATDKYETLHKSLMAREDPSLLFKLRRDAARSATIPRIFNHIALVSGTTFQDWHSHLFCCVFVRMKPQVEIEYCPGCRWLLRAAWTAQELLTTFDKKP